MDIDRLRDQALATLTEELRSCNGGTSGVEFTLLRGAVLDMKGVYAGRELLDYSFSAGSGGISVFAYDLSNPNGKSDFDSIPDSGTRFFGGEGMRSYGIRRKTIRENIGLVVMSWLS